LGKYRFISSKPKEKINFLSEKDFVIDGTRIEVFSNREIIVEGCLGVFEFSDTLIRINLKRGSIIVSGKSFDINGFEEETITIKGIINSIEFCFGE